MKKTILLLFLLGQASLLFAQKAQAPDPELQKYKDRLAAAKHDTTRMMAYVDISNYFRDVQIQNDSALVYALKAEQIANKYPNDPKIVKVLNNLGVVYLKFFLYNTFDSNKKININSINRYFENSQFYFKKSIEAAKKLKNEEYELKAHNNLNQLNVQALHMYDYFKGSLELINKINLKTKWSQIDTTILIITYKNLCIELDNEIGSKKYMNYFTQFKNLTLKVKDSFFYKDLCMLTFEQHVQLGKKSDEQKILSEFESYKDVVLEKIELEQYLIQYYINIQEYDKAFQLSTKLKLYHDDEGENAYTSSNYGMKYMYMGQCAYMLNRNQEAIVYLNKANDYFNSILFAGSLEYEKYTTLLYLGKAYKKAGKYREALACNEQADVRYKQLHDVGVQALMAENDVHLEEIKQEKKLQAARTQTLLKEQEIEIQKKQKYAFLAISILALLSAAWAVYSFIKTRKQNQIISQQAAALEESNLLKDKIFALLSHDLRSPINRLVSSLNQSIESQRTHIQAELKGVQDILNNVLYWASMQLKKATPVYTNIPLQPLADALIDEYQYALEEKSITFLNAIDKDCILKTDEGYLKIVLRNLISNAIKFTPNNGYIQIDCKIKEKIAQISLRDTGVGIAKEKLSSLFQLPMPSVGTNQEQGTGLGLSLSLDIIKKLGGSLNIQSQEGKGTQVEVVLAAVA